MNRRLLLLAPFGAAVLAGAGFWTVLGRMRQGTFDPHDVPSPLIGQPVPEFTLPGLGDGAGFTAAELVAQKRPVLVNFFASWCVPCVIEHPSLMALSREGLPIWGIAYKTRRRMPAASSPGAATPSPAWRRTGRGRWRWTGGCTACRKAT